MGDEGEKKRAKVMEYKVATLPLFSKEEPFVASLLIMSPM